MCRVRVRAGEIVGLYGLIGAGRSEFVHGAVRPAPKTAGRSSGEGKPVDIRREADAIDRGIALAPESRRDQGLCLTCRSASTSTCRSTGACPRARSSGPGRGGRCGRQIARPADQGAPRARLASSLSGGNQQKIVIGKWLNHGAGLFIFDEPTVGVDVGTKAEIYRLFATLLRERRRHHPDLLLPAGSLRTRRHAARLPRGAGWRRAMSARKGSTRNDPGRGHRRLTERCNDNPEGTGEP